MSDTCYRWGADGSKTIQIVSSLSKQPYYHRSVNEALSRIRSKPLGKKLLEAIDNARPAPSDHTTHFNDYVKAAMFLPGVNVVIMPKDMLYTPSGRRKYLENDGSYSYRESSAPQHNPADAPFYRDGKNEGHCSVTHAVDPVAASTKGRGTKTVVQWSNADFPAPGGAVAPAFIVLAHELIHALHHLQGVRAEKDGSPQAEEFFAVGLDDYAGEELTENAIRAEHGVPPRTAL